MSRPQASISVGSIGPTPMPFNLNEFISVYQSHICVISYGQSSSSGTSSKV